MLYFKKREARKLAKKAIFVTLFKNGYYGLNSEGITKSLEFTKEDVMIRTTPNPYLDGPALPNVQIYYKGCTVLNAVTHRTGIGEALGQIIVEYRRGLWIAKLENWYTDTTLEAEDEGLRRKMANLANLEDHSEN